MLGRYRESVRTWVEPIGLVLYRRLGLRPNHLTILGLGVSLLAATAFCTGRTRYGGVLLIMAGLCDFLDGSLARASGPCSICWSRRCGFWPSCRTSRRSSASPSPGGRPATPRSFGRCS
ncbi:MAG: hypothetical protein DME03_14735 [Candidatus Rokuibacteriota bacterium]|nr:MAG: hypothetical protein DME03_14735 [Candidatus Rokubacteria bacterium]